VVRQGDVVGAMSEPSHRYRVMADHGDSVLYMGDDPEAAATTFSNAVFERLSPEEERYGLKDSTHAVYGTPLLEARRLASDQLIAVLYGMDYEQFKLALRYRP
jgi:hypothetical protein